MMLGETEKLGTHQQCWHVKGTEESRGDNTCGTFPAGHFPPEDRNPLPVPSTQDISPLQPAQCRLKSFLMHKDRPHGSPMRRRHYTHFTDKGTETPRDGECCSGVPSLSGTCWPRAPPAFLPRRGGEQGSGVIEEFREKGQAHPWSSDLEGIPRQWEGVE